jgi:hypothetical protein
MPRLSPKTRRLTRFQRELFGDIAVEAQKNKLRLVIETAEEGEIENLRRDKRTQIGVYLSFFWKNQKSQEIIGL